MLLCVVLSLIGTDLVNGFLLSIKGSSVIFVGGVMLDDFHALKEDSSPMNFLLLPQSFVEDGVTKKTLAKGCFLAMGNDGLSGVVSDSGELMVKNAEVEL